MLGDLLSDVLHSMHGLRKSPVSFVAAIASLAFGTALNAAILSVAYGLLVRPLPFAEPDRLVQFTRPQSTTGNLVVARSAFDVWQSSLTSMSVAGYDTATCALRSGTDARTVTVGVVTDNFFQVLEPADLAGEGRLTGPAPVVILNSRLARQLASPDRDRPESVEIGKTRYTVVGVLPDRLAFPTDKVQAWINVDTATVSELFGRNRTRFLRMFGRLRPGVTIDSARTDVRNVEKAIVDQRHARLPTAPADILGLKQSLSGDTRPIALLFSVVGFIVLVMSCTNVATLALQRALRSERDLAIRLALGGRLPRLLRGYLIEGMIVAMIVALLGGGVAYLGVRLLMSVAADDLPPFTSPTEPLPILGASLAIAVIASLVASVFPMMRMRRVKAYAALLPHSGAEPSRTLMRSTLVLGQIAFSMIALTTALVFARSMIGLLSVDPGIRPERAAAIELMLGDTSGQQVPNRRSFVREVLANVGAIPGVTRVGFGSSLPPVSSTMSIGVSRPEFGDADMYSVNLVSVTAGFFDALGINVRKGRVFDHQDIDAAPGSVAMISARLGQEVFGSQDPIGRQIPFAIPGFSGRRPLVIAIVNDVMYDGLGHPPAPTVYLPWEHLPIGDVNLVIRTTTDVWAVVPAVRTMLQSLDPRQPLGAVRSMQDVSAAPMKSVRIQMFVTTVMALLALAIAILGVIGLQATRIAERRREISIRIALGASSARIVSLLMSQSAALGLVGVVVGLGFSFITFKALVSILPSLRPLSLAFQLLLGVGSLGLLLLCALVGALAAKPQRGIGDLHRT